MYASRTRPTDQRAAELLAGDLDALRRKAAEGAAAVADAPAPPRLARAARPIDEVLPAAAAASTYRDLVAGLREAIAQGRLEQGDLVPTVTDLAACYGVARSTAQRAVSLLGAERLIVRNGHRWIVAAMGSAA